MAWRGRFITLSEVDSTGRFEFLYDIFDDQLNQTLYSSLRGVATSKADAIEKMASRANQLKFLRDEMNTIQVGEVVELE